MLYDFDSQLIQYLYNESNSPSPEPTPVAPIVLKGSRKSDRLKGTNGPDIIFGKGGADKINARNGDDIIDPGRWKKGNFDQVKGGKGSDTFIIKDGCWAFIKDFKMIEDKLDLSGLSRGYDWEINGRRIFIYEYNGDEVARLKGKINLSKADIV